MAKEQAKTPKAKTPRIISSQGILLPVEEHSPEKSSPVGVTPHPEFIDVSVRSMMAGVKELRVQVPADCFVRDLKNAIADQCDVLPETQMLLFNDNELKNDDQPLKDYGIKANCSILMNVRMNSGIPFRRSLASSSSILYFVPALLPQKNIGDLRKEILGMKTLKSKEPSVQEETTEGKETRKKMKNLMEKRKKKKMAPSPSPSSVKSSRSAPNSPAANSISSSTILSEDKPLTERELKLFFETAEDLREMKELQNKEYLLPPPQNMEELEKLKNHFSDVAKTRCKTCKKKLTTTEQMILCLCKKYFCTLHREPSLHNCQIDHKQTSRTKLAKENKKLLKKAVNE